MNGECERIRERIAESVTTELAAAQRDEIERHIERCNDCRKYMEELIGDDGRLNGFVKSLESSVVGIERNIMGRISALSLEEKPMAAPPIGESGAAPRSTFFGARMFKYAAAAVIAIGLIWGAFYVSGFYHGSSPAFASVLENIQKAHSVTYRESYSVEGTQPFAAEKMVTQAGKVRSVLPHGDVIIYDYQNGRTLHLMQRIKRAELTRRIGEPESAVDFNYLEWMLQLHKKSGSFQGRERLDGKEAYVFLIKEGEFSKRTVWVDVETELPMRIELVSLPHPDEDIVVPEIHLSTLDFGGDGAVSRSIIISDSGGIQKKSTIVFDNFRWNVDLDQSLFRMEPPEDYALEERTLDVSDRGEKDLIDALSLWASMSYEKFPMDINDLSDPGTLKPLLVRAFDKDGDPAKELDLALEAANRLLKGLMFVQGMKLEGSWHYSGAGVGLGDAKAPVCWWKPEGSDAYRVVFGDLRAADLDAEDLFEIQKK
jgi:hypothetical protein